MKQYLVLTQKDVVKALMWMLLEESDTIVLDLLPGSVDADGSVFLKVEVEKHPEQ